MYSSHYKDLQQIFHFTEKADSQIKILDESLSEITTTENETRTLIIPPNTSKLIHLVQQKETLERQVQTVDYLLFQLQIVEKVKSLRCVSNSKDPRWISIGSEVSSGETTR